MAGRDSACHPSHHNICSALIATKGAAHLLGRGDDAVVAPLLHGGPQLGQLSHNGLRREGWRGGWAAAAPGGAGRAAGHRERRAAWGCRSSPAARPHIRHLQAGPSSPKPAWRTFMRSVSLTRQLYTSRMAVGPSASSAATAAVIAASGMSLQLWSMALSWPRGGPANGRKLGQFPICSHAIVARAVRRSTIPPKPQQPGLRPLSPVMVME